MCRAIPSPRSREVVALAALLVSLTAGFHAAARPPDTGLKIQATITRQPATPCVTPPPDLVGWWPLNGNLLDALTGSSGTLSGAPVFVAGQVQQGLRFHGGTDGVAVPATPALNVGAGDGVSVELWINPSDLSTRSPLVEWSRGIDDGADIVPWGVHLWILRPDEFGLGAGNLYANVREAGGFSRMIMAPGGTLVANAWQHVALTYDRTSGQARLYRNGQVVADLNLGSFIPETSRNLYFGRRPAGEDAMAYTGLLDEVAVYRRVLAPEEILAIFNAGSSGKCPTGPTGDGIPNSWREQYFGPDYATDPQAAATADPDGDGANNYREYLDGTDSTDPLSVRRAPLWVSTFAGSGLEGGADGYRTNANFHSLAGIKRDRAGRLWVNEAYLTGFWSVGVGGHRIRIIETNGQVNTFAGSDEPGLVEGPAATARFRGPMEVVFDSQGNTFVSDRLNHRIRRIAPDGLVSTFAGSVEGFQDGPGAGAQFYMPIGLAIDPSDNLYVADFGNTRIRKITPDGVVSTVAGSIPGHQDGDVSVATFNGPNDVEVGPGGSLYVSDWANGCLRRISPEGMVSTFASGLLYNHAVQVDAQGDIYAVCGGCYALVKFRPDGTELWRYAPEQGFRDGPADDAQVAFFGDGLVLPDGNYLLNDTHNRRVRLFEMGVQPLLTLDPPGGTFTISRRVTIATDVSGGEVRYTLDGTEPTVAARLYTSPITLTDTTTVKARVYVNGHPVSEIASATFTEVTVPCATVPLGLTAWWPGEGDGTDLVSTNLAVLEGGATFGQGAVGQGFSFPTPDASVRVPAGPSLDVGKARVFSIESWIRPIDLTQRQPLVEWREAEGRPGVSFFIEPGEEWGRLGIQLAETNGGLVQILSGAEVATPFEFQHVAFTCNGLTGQAQFYRNGVLLDTFPVGRNVQPTAGDLYLGRGSVGWGSSNLLSFAGLLDEVSLYQRVLTSNQLGAIYRAAGGKCQSPIPPAIVLQPQDLSVFPGGTATFSVYATGTEPLAYRWRRNNITVPGVSNATLTLFNVAPTNAGAYSVVISNLAGAVISSNAILTVLSSSNSISLSPPGGTFTNSVAVSILSSTTNADLRYTRDGTEPSFDSLLYTGPIVLTTNDAPAPAGLTLKARAFTNALPATPVASGTYIVVSIPPTNQPPCSNAPPGITAWWPGEGSGADLAGTNAALLEGGAGFAPGVAGSGFSFATSQAAVRVPAGPALDVGSSSGLTIELWINPADITRRSPLAEWRDATGVAGVSFFIAPGVSAGRLGAVLANTNGGFSEIITDSELITGGVFQHVALTYDRLQGYAQFYRNGTMIGFSNVGRVAQPTTADFWLGRGRMAPFAPESAEVSFAGLLDEAILYNRALTSNQLAAVYMAGAAGKCPDRIPPLIVLQPQSQIVPAGGDVTFSVYAVGTEPLIYRWRRNGMTILVSTNGTLTLTNVSAATGSNFTVVITNRAGFILSSNAVLTLLPVPDVLSFSPSGGTYTNTVTVSLNTSATNAVIHYTRDGTEPNLGSLRYVAPIVLTTNDAPAPTGLTLKARAFTNDLPATPVVSGTYVVVPGPAANLPPIVALTSPTNGMTFPAGALITLAATASDPDGFVTQVLFYQSHDGLSLIGMATNPPYSKVWSSATGGLFTLSASAWDNRGAESTSAPVSITIQSPAVPLTLVPAGAVWKYLDNGTDQGTAWRAPAFDDSAWAMGPAQLGYGDGDEATLIGFGPEINNKYITTYFRRAFAVTNAASLTDVTLRLLRDDGGIVYLNGIEVFRSNMPEGPANYLTLASTSAGSPDESTFFPASLPAGLLLEGANWLAAEIHQNAPVSSDLSFDLELVAQSQSPSSNRPPTVVFVSPTETFFPVGTPITFTALASDPDGFVTRVEFLLNTNTVLGVVTNPPYTVVRSDIPVGGYLVTARAYDNRGASTDSGHVLIIEGPVNTNEVVIAFDPPTIPGAIASIPSWSEAGFVFGLTISTNPSFQHVDSGALSNYPANGSAYLRLPIGPSNRRLAFSNALGSAFTLLEVQLAEAQVPAGSSSNLALVGYRAGTAVATQVVALDRIVDGTGPLPDFQTVAVSPAFTQLDRVTVSGYPMTSFTAFALDNVRLVLGEAATNLPPTVALLTPTNGAVFSPRMGILLTAAAADPDGLVSRVEYFDGMTFLGVATDPPYAVVWSNAPPGTHVLTARATDHRGATGDSALVTITVQEPVNIPPTVTFLAPADGDQFEAGQPITIIAEGADADGFVQRIELLRGSNVLATAINEPILTAIVSNWPAGAYVVTARVFDNLGASSSAQVNLAVLGQTGTNEIVITLDPPTAPRGTAFLSTWSEAGFIVTAPSNRVMHVDSGAATNYPANGSAYFRVNLTPAAGPLSFANALGQTFDLLSVDLAEGQYPPTPATNLAIIGYRWDSSVVTQICTLDRIIDGTGPLPDFQTFPLSPQFTQLTRVAVGNPGAPLPILIFAIDNVRVRLGAPPTNQPPAVALTQPADGAAYTEGDSVTLTATASDSDGSIAQVAFYAGATLLGIDTNSPYSLTWPHAPAGTHTLTARATDNLGATSTSSAVTIVVEAEQPPQVGELVLRFEPASLPGGSKLIDSWTESGFFLTTPGRLAHTDAGLSWQPDNGTACLQFLAGDAPLIVSNLLGQPFALKRVDLAEYSTVVASAKAIPFIGYRNDGSVVTQTFTLDGIIDGTGPLVDFQTFTFGSQFTNLLRVEVPVDVYSLDNVRVLVPMTNQLPVVSLVSPTNDAVFLEGDHITLEAVAADPDGQVVQVEFINFFLETNLLGVVTQPPYRFVLSNAVPAIYGVAARVTDDKGGISYSTVVTFRVKFRPVVTLLAPADGATLVSPAAIPIAATASVVGGTIQQIEILEGSNALTTVWYPQGPITFTWSNVPPGAYTLSARALDDRGTVGHSTPVHITVAVNAPPAFTKGPDQAILEDAGPQAVPHWATGISPGPPWESSQTVVFRVETDHPGIFAAPPAIAPDGTLTYTPARCGTARVTVVAQDDGGTASGGSDTSAPQTFTIQVLDNRPPQVSCPADIALEATSDAGATVFYTASASDSCGLADITCTPPSGTLFPIGTSAVTCRATDLAGHVGSCTFQVTVTTPNQPPVCETTFPDAWVEGGTFYTIAVDGATACVVLDGSGTTDPDQDALTCTWLIDETNSVSGTVATLCLGTGCHAVVLVASDGQAASRCERTLCVITAGEAVEQTLALVESTDVARKNKRALVATLKAAQASFDRGNSASGMGQLRAFQNKVRAQIAKANPAEAAAFIASAQRILDAMAGAAQ